MRKVLDHFICNEKVVVHLKTMLPGVVEVRIKTNFGPSATRLLLAAKNEAEKIRALKYARSYYQNKSCFANLLRRQR